MTQPLIDFSDQTLDPFAFTVRLHQALRIPVKIEATKQGKSVKAFVEEALIEALSKNCDCGDGLEKAA